MNDVPNSELLSAYLDGELTAAERAHVEQLLSTSPAARQSMDELRALSSTIRGLPSQKLGEDLSQLVLRTAERRMLTGGDQRSEPADATQSSGWGGPSWRGMLSRRALVWSGLAAGIALMIVWNEPPRQARELAVAPKAVETPEARRAAGPPPTMQAPGGAVASSPKESQPKRQLALARKDARPASEPSLGRQLAADKAPAEKTAADKAPAEKAAADSDAGEKLALKRVAVDKVAATTGGTNLARKAPAEPQALAARQQAEKFGGQQSQMRSGPQLQTSVGLEQQAMQAPAAAGPAMAKPTAAMPSAPMAAAAPPPRSELAKAAEGGGAKAGSSFGIAGEVDRGSVIRADVSFEAARNRAFEQLLATNGVGIRSRVRQSESVDRLQEPQNAAAPMDSGNKPVAERESAEKRSAGPDTLRRQRQPLLVYEVDATPAQIESLLKQLTQKSDAFSSVSVSSPSDRKKMERALATNEGLAGRQSVAEATPHRNLQIQSRSRASMPSKSEGAAQSMSDAAVRGGGAAKGADGIAQKQPMMDAQTATAGKGQLEEFKKKSDEPKPGAQRVVFVLRVLDRVQASNAAAPAATKP